MASYLEKYRERITEERLSSELFLMCQNFSSKIDPELSGRFSMQIKPAGSVAALKAVYLVEEKPKLHDIDFHLAHLSRPSGIITFPEAMQLRRDDWFWNSTQAFLQDLGCFVTTNKITCHIIEVDFGYRVEEGQDMLYFAIGLYSPKPVTNSCYSKNL